MIDTEETKANLMYNLPNVRYKTRHFRQLVVTYETLARKLTLAYRWENIFVKEKASYLVDIAIIYAVSIVLTESSIWINFKQI